MGAPVIRGNTVEVRVRENDVEQALTKLRELSQPLGGFLGSTGRRSLDIVNAGGGLIQLTVVEPAIIERVRQVVDQSIEIIERRVNQLGLVEPSIQRQGTDRILVQVPGLGDPQQLIDIIGKTAKLTFRLVDMSMTPQQALETRPPPESEIVYGSKAEGRQPYLLEKRVIVSGEELTDAQPGFDQRTSEPIVTFRFNSSGARKFARGDAGEHRAAIRHRARRRGDFRTLYPRRHHAGRRDRSPATSPSSPRTTLPFCCEPVHCRPS